MFEPETTENDGVVVVDHLFRPYCSGFNLLKMVTQAFENVQIRRHDVTTISDRQMAELPSHVEQAIRMGEPRGFGGSYYVNGKLVRSDMESLERAIENAGGQRNPEASVWHHPVPKSSDTSPGLMVRRVTAEDISGAGEALPSFWCDLNASDEEVRAFLLRATQKQGCCMMGAYMNGEVSGFITFFNSETREIPGAQRVSDGALRITCLHVFPHRRRQGVGTALVQEVVRFAREKGYRRVFANAGYADIGSAFKGTPAGSRGVYNKLGFRLLQLREPSAPGDEGEAVMEYLLNQ